MTEVRKEGVRILLVEDEPSIRDVVRLHLELAGYEVEESGHGRQALERLRAEAFGLVVLDVMLPGLDGVSLCRAMRTSGPNTDTPVLMLTARATESDTVLGLESGADRADAPGIRRPPALDVAAGHRLQSHRPAA